MAQAILAGAILIAPHDAAADDAMPNGAMTARADIIDVERVVVSVEGGAALLSLYFSKVEIAIAGEDRSDVFVTADDGRSGPGLSQMRPRVEKDGKTLALSFDFGAFTLVRIGGGQTRVHIAVPSSYRGELEVSMPDGTLGIFDLRLSSLSASINDGKLNLERVNAADLLLSARDANTTLARVASGNGSIKSDLGRIDARELSGSWTIRGSDGSVRLSLAPTFGPIDAKTDLASVTIDVPIGSPFRFEGESALRKPSADFPLDVSVAKKFPRETKVARGEVGAGGPLIFVTTAEGKITVTRSGR